MAPQVVARTCVFDKLPILRPVHVKRADVDRIVAEARQERDVQLNASVGPETGRQDVSAYNRSVKAWVRKCSDFDEERAADREFWAQMTPSERVSALEELRAQWKSTSADGHEGLRRTVRVLQRPAR
jgi:hypothetical protein